MPTVTKRWSDERYGALGAQLSFDIIGVSTVSQALSVLPFTLNSQHPENSELRCEPPTITRPGLNLFRAECTFTVPEDGSEHPPDGTFSPVGQPARFRWEFGSTTEPIERDIDGFPILNSALDPFDPQLTEEYPARFLIVTRYEFAPFNVARADSFWNAVNAAAVTFQGQGFAPGTMCCRMIRPIGEYTANAKWVEVEYTFEVRADGFRRRILDQGFRSYYDDSGTTKPTAIYHPDGTPVSQPVRLDGAGKPLNTQFKGKNTSGAPVTLVSYPGTPLGRIDKETTADAVFLRRHTKKEVDYSALGI